MAFSGNQTTRKGLYGGARSPYGSFAGKTEATPAFSSAPLLVVSRVSPTIVIGYVSPTVARPGKV